MRCYIFIINGICFIYFFVIDDGYLEIEIIKFNILNSMKYMIVDMIIFLKKSFCKIVNLI